MPNGLALVTLPPAETSNQKGIFWVTFTQKNRIPIGVLV